MNDNAVMRNLSRRFALLAFAAALPAFAGADELTVVSRVTVNQGAPTTSTQYIGAQKIRSSDGEHDTIVDVAAGRFTVINHRKKEYTEFTREDMAAAMQKFEQQMSGPMAGMFEKMMGGKVGEVAVKKGASRKVAGYDCTDYTYTLGENMKYEVCSTQALQLPDQLYYYDALKGPYSMMGPMGKRFEKLFDEMKKIKGFPIAMSSTVNMMAFKMQINSEATEVKKGAIPASAFVVPAGYTKKDMPFKR
jgi:predicted nucleic-acid-binding Zn-ribbon protein